MYKCLCIYSVVADQRLLLRPSSSLLTRQPRAGQGSSYSRPICTTVLTATSFTNKVTSWPALATTSSLSRPAFSRHPLPSISRPESNRQVLEATASELPPHQRASFLIQETHGHQQKFTPFSHQSAAAKSAYMPTSLKVCLNSCGLYYCM
ncbi:unnamed protein product [Protopolystoma xenopodis]|uniref:Uncharacterized protein n=1 Tax=Protopolystoma xenopodis TaxID=117903 RepID=A0A3S5BN61_9PLAT|nr:unnamed protein product [Protopolystoma xenopodis]